MKKWKFRGFILLIGLASSLTDFFSVALVTAQSAPNSDSAGRVVVEEKTLEDQLVLRTAVSPAPTEATPNPVTPTAITVRPTSPLVLVATWSLLLSGFGLVLFFLWRQYQSDKSNTRWKKRQPKWRFF